MKVSIVIPTYNHCDDLLKPCIESIINTTDLTDVEVIVVANGCKDNTREYLDLISTHQLKNGTWFPLKEIWSDEPWGYTKATNEGIKIATGEYIVLLNNDVVLLPQKKNFWIDALLKPFSDPLVGITGAMMQWNYDIHRKFMIFFCVMIPAKIFAEFGLLDEWFSPGGGEDTDYCIKLEDAGYKMVEVCGTNKSYTENMMISDFPLFHPGEGTMHDKVSVPNWNEIFAANSQKLIDRYGRLKDKQFALCNNYERAVISRHDVIPDRETTRYNWAKQNIHGNKILEIGCSSGYGTRFYNEIQGLDYLGVDYDAEIIKFARSQFDDIPGVKFRQCDITKEIPEGHFDTIIAFEVIEHLDNGKEIVQELKNHCDTLLITVPYKEPPGFWGVHHKIHNITEQDFPDFEYQYINNHSIVSNTPTDDPSNLIIMKWSRFKTEPLQLPTLQLPKQQKQKVTCSISTRNRYYTTLPLCLNAIINQTVVPDELIIFDDGDHTDLRNVSLYQNIFRMFEYKGIDWKVVFGAREGQVKNHQLTLEMAKHPLIWRLDDDNAPEPNVLETLLKYIDNDGVAAVAGLIIDPKNGWNPNPQASNKIIDIYKGLNEQWFKPMSDYETKDVDHLYSSFLFKRSAANHGYEKTLSRVGHREETIFTYTMRHAGWRLLITPQCTTWHFHEPTGGIRDNTKVEMWNHDEEIFKDKLREWKIFANEPKFIALDNGIGDHYAFKSILPEILEKYNNITLAVCYPQVFATDYPNIPLISIAEATQRYGNLDNWNLYKYMADKNWTASVIKAYRSMYLYTK